MPKFDAINGDVYESRVCKECGKPFVITNGEIEDLKKRCGDKFALPLRCKDCRGKKGQVYRLSVCKKCGCQFTISLLEKDDYIRKGLELPKHCPACRAKTNKRRRYIPDVNISKAVDM